MDHSERTHSLSSWALVLALAALLVPRAVSAQAAEPPAPRITDHQRWLIAGSAGGAYAEGRGGSSSPNWFVRVAPAATYFVRDRIGVGAALNGGVGEGTAGYYTVRSSELGGGVTGTFEVPLSSRLGLLLRPFLGYIQQWRHITATGGTFGVGAQTSAPGALIQEQGQALAARKQELGSLRAALGIELLVHLSPHVGLAAGPEAWFDLLFYDDTRSAVVNMGLQGYRIQVGLSVSLLFGI